MEELRLQDFIYPEGYEEFKFTPSTEDFYFTEKSSVMIKLYLATYYAMSKRGIVTPKTTASLKEHILNQVCDVIDNCSKYEK